jgi:hypothetical protein
LIRAAFNNHYVIAIVAGFHLDLTLFSILVSFCIIGNVVVSVMSRTLIVGFDREIPASLNFSMLGFR